MLLNCFNPEGFSCIDVVVISCITSSTVNQRSITAGFWWTIL